MKPSVLVFLTLLLQGPAAMAQEIKDADSIIERLQKRYDSTIDLVADFRQETEFKTLRRTLQARGKLYFKRPGKMLWRYDQPKDQVLLGDGKSLYFYQPEQGQVVKSPLGSAFRSDIPLSFLLGMGNLRRDFQAMLKGFEKGNYLLELRPKLDSGGIGEFFLGIEGEQFDILWARIRDPAGNVTTVRFFNLQRGVGLRDSLFRLQVPEGVDVVELGSSTSP